MQYIAALLTIAVGIPGPVSIFEKTSYRKISWSLEGAWFVFRIVRSLWNLTGTSAALLPMFLSNFKAIRQFKVQISWLRDFTRSYNKTLDLSLFGYWDGAQAAGYRSISLTNCLWLGALMLSMLSEQAVKQTMYHPGIGCTDYDVTEIRGPLEMVASISRRVLVYEAYMWSCGYSVSFL